MELDDEAILPLAFRQQRRGSNENAVSSRGCSRIFIIFVLKEALKYCRSLSNSPDFPFAKSLVKTWLENAKKDCATTSQLSLQRLGGIEFSSTNTASYWTEPKQFFTWWKNNIERKNKFHNLQRDSETITNEKSLLRQRIIFYESQNLVGLIFVGMSLILPIIFGTILREIA
jgi:hypothetical protein